MLKSRISLFSVLALPMLLAPRGAVASPVKEVHVLAGDLHTTLSLVGGGVSKTATR